MSSGNRISQLSQQRFETPIDLDVLEVQFLETEHVSSTRGIFGFGFGNTNVARTADCEPAVAEDADDLEAQEPLIDIEMFEVQFLETENNSSNLTGSGVGIIIDLDLELV